MIALRTIDELPCAFDVSIEALATLLNANDRCFGCPRGCPREPPGHAPPAFLFLSSTMSNSGESLVTLRSDASDTNRCRSPLGRYRQHSASCIRNAHRDVGTGERRASLSRRGYRCDSLGESSILSQKFAAAKARLSTRFAHLRPADLRQGGTRCAGLQPAPAPISPRLEPNFARLTEPQPSVAKLFGGPRSTWSAMEVAGGMQCLPQLS
jgi:hypothetical protein